MRKSITAALAAISVFALAMSWSSTASAACKGKNRVCVQFRVPQNGTMIPPDSLDKQWGQVNFVGHGDSTAAKWTIFVAHVRTSDLATLIEHVDGKAVNLHYDTDLGEQNGQGNVDPATTTMVVDWSGDTSWAPATRTWIGLQIPHAFDETNGAPPGKVRMIIDPKEQVFTDSDGNIYFGQGSKAVFLLKF